MALIPDQKFSTFVDGGDLQVDDIVVGLRDGLNTKFNFTGEIPPGIIVQIDQGGTGATTAAGARTNLGLGTIATQDADNVVITGGQAVLATCQGGNILLDGNSISNTQNNPLEIIDSLENVIAIFKTTGSLTSNYLEIDNATTGNGILLQSAGGDTDVAFRIFSKNSGSVILGSQSTAHPLTFLSGTSYQHTTNINFPDTANAVTATFQDSSGTLAYLSDVPSVTPAALTANNDSNVTLTLGGSPTNALLQATSITAGWSGILPLTRGGVGIGSCSQGDILYSAIDNSLTTLPKDTNATRYLSNQGSSNNPLWTQVNLANGITGFLGMSNGGTNNNISPSNGGIIYSNSTQMAILNGTGTANLPLLSGSNSSPTWSAFALSLGGDFSSAGALTLSGAFPTTFTFTSGTSVTFPTSGTLATTSQLPTPAALTSSNDTNVTITLGGTPTTALLQATSLTMGWTGQLSLARGGTNASLTASNGGMVYTDASHMQILAGDSTAGKMLQSGASSAPSWSLNTWPAATPINNLLYATSADVIGNLATQVNSFLTTDSTGNIAWTTGVTYSPVVTFGTNGDLSVVYAKQEGRSWKIGDLEIVRIHIQFTPTYTTSSGNFIISLPTTAGSNANLGGSFSTAPGLGASNFPFPAGTTQITPQATGGAATVTLTATGSSTTAKITITQIPTAIVQEFIILCVYITT